MESYIPKKRTWKEKFKRFFFPYPAGIDYVHYWYCSDHTDVYGIIGKREYRYFLKEQAVDCYVKDCKRILGEGWQEQIEQYERWKKKNGI